MLCCFVVRAIRKAAVVVNNDINYNSFIWGCYEITCCFYREIKWSSPGGGWIKALIHKSGRHHTPNGRVTKNTDLYQRQELHQPLYLPVSCARLSCAKLFMLVRHYLRVQAAPFLSVFSEAFVHSHLEQAPFCKAHCFSTARHNVIEHPDINQSQGIR